MTEQDCSPFQNRAIFQVTAQAAAAFRPRPGIAAEVRTAGDFHCLDNVRLERCQPVADEVQSRAHWREGSLPGAASFGASARQPMSRRYCWPLKCVRATASYAATWARLMESPRAVTHSTRPPDVLRTPSSKRVPA